MSEEKLSPEWQMWSDNFFDSKRFFETKGNIKTKSRLKDKWLKNFEKNLIKVLAHQKGQNNE